MPKQSTSQKPEEMSPLTGHTITTLAFMLPAAALGLLGHLIGNQYTAGGLMVLWFGILFALSIRFIRKRTFLVVERFGYFWDVKFAGPCMIIPFVDSIVLEENFLQKSVKLFEGITIDFTDGSAPVDAVAWFQIGNPKDIDDGNFEEVTEQVLRYTYRVKATEREARAKDIFEGAFRALLEAKKLAEVEKEVEELAESSLVSAKVTLTEIGIFPFPGKGIIVSDIVLPAAIIGLREEILRGAAEAQAQQNKSATYWQVIASIKKGLEASGFQITDDEVIEIYLQQIALETLQKTGSKLSFVASNISEVMRSMTTIGTTSQEGVQK